jgi:hypothetical protein
MTTPEEAARRMVTEILENDGWSFNGDEVFSVARALLASTAREAKLREALENIEDIATTGRISELVEKFNTMKLIAREALADKETT